MMWGVKSAAFWLFVVPVLVAGAILPGVIGLAGGQLIDLGDHLDTLLVNLLLVMIPTGIIITYVILSRAPEPYVMSASEEEGIQKGLDDIAAGRTRTHDEVRRMFDDKV